MRLIKQWFDTSNPDSALAARYITLILWVIGSFYLISYEWNKQDTDWIILISTPIVWATIISLPILAIFAYRNGEYLACVLIAISAIVGSIYTITNTISRQAILRDSNVEISDINDEKRSKIKKSLENNQKMLNEELLLKLNKCDKNLRFDCTRIRESIGVYERAVKSDKHDLEKLGNPVSLLAGESRIALFLMNFSNKSEEQLRILVALVYPAIFGIFLELTALATAMFGWHNYGNVIATTYSSRLSDKTFRIDVLEHQLKVANQSGNSVDIKLLTKQLSDAKSNLRKELDR